MVARPHFIVLNQISCTDNTPKGYSTGSTLDGALSLVISRRRVEKEENMIFSFPCIFKYLPIMSQAHDIFPQE